MITIYLPYFLLMLLVLACVSGLAGYLLCGAFVKGKRIDENNYEILLKEEGRKRKLLEKELALEIEHGKQLEEANQAILYDREESFKKTFAEMRKHQNKVLLDPESNKEKIPNEKKFKRRKLGKRSA